MRVGAGGAAGAGGGGNAGGGGGGRRCAWRLKTAFVAGDPGKYIVEEAGVDPRCVPCRKGTSSIGGVATACSQCLPGTHQPFEGQVGCIRCSPGTYTVSSGAHECTVCPAQSSNFIVEFLEFQQIPIADVVLNSSADCICKEGQFTEQLNHQQRPKCTDCQQGGLCCRCANAEDIAVQGTILQTIEAEGRPCSSCLGGADVAIDRWSLTAKPGYWHPQLTLQHTHLFELIVLSLQICCVGFTSWQPACSGNKVIFAVHNSA